MTETLAPAPASTDEISLRPSVRDGRLVSLDVMRGVTIAAMVMVNNPAVGPPYLYSQLTHAVWNGWTFADAIFPAFLFMAGVSLAFSRPSARRLARRVILLFALGLVVNAAPLVFAHVGLGPLLHEIRIMGVLQRIAIAYLLGVAIVTWCPPRWHLLAAATILVLNWVALIWIYVPGIGAGHLTPTGNLEGWVDRQLLGPAHMYRAGAVGYDPEGLLGSVPAAVTVVVGYWGGRFLRRRSHNAGRNLAGAAAALIALGAAWGAVLPINKRMWTGSYVLFMGGISLGILALLHVALDGERRAATWWATPWQALGANAIAVYVGTELTGAALSTYRHQYAHHPAAISTWIWGTWLRPDFGAKPGAIVYAALILMAWWLIAAVLYRQRWFIRV